MSIKKRIPKGCRRRVAVAYQDSMRRGQVVSETKGRLNSRIGPYRKKIGLAFSPVRLVRRSSTHPFFARALVLWDHGFTFVGLDISSPIGANTHGRRW